MIESFYIPCTRKRKTGETQNSKYQTINTYTYTSINGYIGSLSNNPGENTISEKTTYITKRKFFCDDLELQFGDLIIYDSKIYDVISEPTNSGGFGHHVKAIVRFVEDVY
jgi:hypothetical protein